MINIERNFSAYVLFSILFGCTNDRVSALVSVSNIHDCVSIIGILQMSDFKIIHWQQGCTKHAKMYAINYKTHVINYDKVARAKNFLTAKPRHSVILMPY